MMLHNYYYHYQLQWPLKEYKNKLFLVQHTLYINKNLKSFFKGSMCKKSARQSEDAGDFSCPAVNFILYRK